MRRNRPSRNRPGASIRGPHSALTDFLASQNISASRIRADAQARRDAAAAAVAAAAAASTAAAAAAASSAPSIPPTTRSRQDRRQEDEDSDEDDVIDSSQAATAARRARDQKRRKQQETIEKIKKAKSAKKRKREDSPESDDDLALALFNAAAAPPPGQGSNCEICRKRFTVTPYSRTGPNGGLLCKLCGEELAKDEDANSKHRKKRGAVPKPAMGRRKMQSRILDGTYDVGAKPLMALCIETLASNIHLADNLGDLTPAIIDRIARLLSKSRLLDSRTLDLFLQRHHNILNVYDAAKLKSDDFIKIFQLMPQLQSLKLRNAIQFTDSVMQYLITRNMAIESIYIHGANLLTHDMWAEFLKQKGLHLKAFQVYYTDRYFDNKLVKLLPGMCPDLRRLKICHNQEVSDEGVKCIAKISKLEHLGLHCMKKTSTLPYVSIIQKIGPQLQTFSINRVPGVDDRLLDAIHEKCTNLSKLRITDSEVMTDAGFVRLFRGWKNKRLSFIDLQKCRYVNASRPRDNEHMIGLCSQGFEALMEHSGGELKHLNVHACRHISRQTFENVFASDKVYRQMRYLEISFCEEVNDFVVGSIFRSCPNLRELNVFGCMKVKDVRVPRGKILVGVPNAVGMRIEGVDD